MSLNLEAPIQNNLELMCIIARQTTGQQSQGSRNWQRRSVPLSLGAEPVDRGLLLTSGTDNCRWRRGVVLLLACVIEKYGSRMSFGVRNVGRRFDTAVGET
jgi:hypothetical protein